MSDRGVNKEILFLSPFFYPEKISTGKYNTFLVRKIIEKRGEVDVVAICPFYPEWAVRNDFDELSGVTVHRYGCRLKFPKSQVLRRLMLELFYFFYVYRHLRSIEKSYDVICAVFPPTLFGFIVSNCCPAASKVAILHDIQGVMATASSSYYRKIIGRLIGYAERMVLSRYDKVVCLSESMRDLVVKRFMVEESRCIVAYPFVTIKKMSNKEDRRGGFAQYFDDDKTHVVYSGALGEKQRPSWLYDLFVTVSRRDESIMCHIFSNGPEFERLKNKNTIFGSSNVLFHDLVDEEDVPLLYAYSSVQVVPQHPGTGDGAFPSKLPNLVALGVPIFAICDSNSEMELFLSNVKFVSVTNSWDIDALADKLILFLEETKDVSHDMISHVNSEVVKEKFDPNKLLDLF